MTDPSDNRRDQATFQALSATLAYHVRSEFPPGKVRRDAHPKHHGCVEALFKVAEDVPLDLQYGVFKPGAEYRALIRFSNAFKIRHDLERDARGMAIKLELPESASEAPNDRWQRVQRPDLFDKPANLMPEGILTQDFLLVTHSEFFGRDAAEFFETVTAIIAGGSKISAVFLHVLGTFFRPPRFRWRQAVALFRSFTVTMNPLFLTYFSQTPYRVGPADATDESHAVKFCARPKQRPGLLAGLGFTLKTLVFMLTFNAIGPHRNFLRRVLTAYLRTRGAEFAFCIQRRTDAASMPIDNATVPWSTWKSPYLRVATIRIPRDECYRNKWFVRKRLRLGERLTFSPWHALEQHRPLGSINLARLFVYARVSRTRNGLNKKNACVPPPG
ncbi:MAG TPA: hypothetical protein VGF24_12190 [Vicinamibacterales bacterium]|jgi:hypothetical protein